MSAILLFFYEIVQRPVRSLRNWHLYVPRSDPVTPGMLNMWLRTASGEKIKQGALRTLLSAATGSGPKARIIG